MDRLDPFPARLERRAEVNRLVLDEDLPGIGNDRPGQRLDQRRLAGAVVPDHRQDLPRQKVEIGAVQGNDAAEVLDQAVGS